MVEESERFMREHIPKSRLPEEDYFRHIFGVRKYGLQLADILSSGFKGFIRGRGAIPRYYIRRTGKPRLRVSHFLTNGYRIDLVGKI